MNKETISKVMSEAGKMSHKKSPRPKGFYSAMGKLSHAKRPRSKKFYQMMNKKRWGK